MVSESENIYHDYYFNDGQSTNYQKTLSWTNDGISSYNVMIQGGQDEGHSFYWYYGVNCNDTWMTLSNAINNGYIQSYEIYRIDGWYRWNRSDGDNIINGSARYMDGDGYSSGYKIIINTKPGMNILGAYLKGCFENKYVSEASITRNYIPKFTSLTNVYIPKSVTSIGNNSFKNVPHIYYKGTASGANWGAISIN